MNTADSFAHNAVNSALFPPLYHPLSPDFSNPFSSHNERRERKARDEGLAKDWRDVLYLFLPLCSLSLSLSLSLSSLDLGPFWSPSRVISPPCTNQIDTFFLHNAEASKTRAITSALPCPPNKTKRPHLEFKFPFFLNVQMG